MRLLKFWFEFLKISTPVSYLPIQTLFSNRWAKTLKPDNCHFLIPWIWLDFSSPLRPGTMKTAANITAEKDLKDIHFDTLEWKSSLQFIIGEIHFINQLLNSYVFEPTTPNLFERLQEFKEQIVKVEEEIQSMNQSIRKHESELGGMLECDTISCDSFYYKEHQSLKKMFDNFCKTFRELKSDVFSYAGGILKKKKK